MNEKARFVDTNQYEDDEECPECGGEGILLNDCFDDTCCCAEPEESHGYRACPYCGEKGEPAPQAKLICGACEEGDHHMCWDRTRCECSQHSDAEPGKNQNA